MINLESEPESDSDSDSKSKPESDNDSDSLANSSRCSPKEAIVKRSLEFDGSVEYYVDKSANKRHLKWETLPPLTRPKYSIKLRRLADPNGWRSKQRKMKKRPCLSKYLQQKAEPKLTAAEAAEKTQRIQELQSLVANEPQQLNNWIELHQLLGQNVSKSNRLAVAEQQLHKLETALEHHAGNEQLLKLYVDTASATYPDSQVGELTDEKLVSQTY